MYYLYHNKTEKMMEIQSGDIFAPKATIPAYFLSYQPLSRQYQNKTEQERAEAEHERLAESQRIPGDMQVKMIPGDEKIKIIDPDINGYIKVETVSGNTLKTDRNRFYIEREAFFGYVKESFIVKEKAKKKMKKKESKKQAAV